MRGGARPVPSGIGVAWFEDLTPYTYVPHGPDGLNVGWLDDSHPFSTGEVDPEFVQRLIRLAVEHAINITRGWHQCPFCRGEYPSRVRYSGRLVSMGDAEIRVRHANGVVLAAPNLVAHYVIAHRYLPPGLFIEAIMADPRLDKGWPRRRTRSPSPRAEDPA